MNPGRDALIIFLLIIGLAIVFVAVANTAPRSGVQAVGRSLVVQSAKTPDRTSTQTSSNSTQERPKTEREREREREMLEIERQIADAEREVAQLELLLEEIELYGEKSPYENMVTISRSNTRTDDPTREYVLLEANSKNTSGITITGWKLKSSITGRSITIGDGVELFFSGEPNSDTPIALYPGEKAYITTGRSPIGESFKVNKCSGYFTQFQKFYPSLRKRCPDPEEEIRYYTRDTSIFNDDVCLDFVDRMRACTVQVDPLPLKMSFACQDAIITEINYSSCIEKHKDDSDFYQDEWRVYLRRDDPLWKEKRELIILYDRNGKTVDYISY